MKRCLWLVILLCGLTAGAWAQYPVRNGGSYTPQGAVTYFIVLHDAVAGQEPEPGASPAQVQALFYGTDTGFASSAADRTLSNRLYRNSLGASEPFRLSAFVHPEIVHGPRDSVLVELNRYYRAHPQLPGFWQRFDRRTNKPHWCRFDLDNRDTPPDGVFDGLVLVSTDVRVTGGNSGVTPLDFFNKTLLEPSGLRADAMAGFRCTATDAGHLEGVFLHEWSHSIYKSPHHSGANGVFGPYWYATEMYSLINFGKFNSVVPAWERWLLGWMNLPPDHDLTPKTHPHSTRVVLHDFVTRGQALRVALPGSGQQLWFEFYGDSTVWTADHPLWYRSTFTQDGSGNTIPQMQRGLSVYLTDLGEPTVGSHLGGRGPLQINGVRRLTGHPVQALHMDSLVHPDRAFWGNAVGRFRSGRAEPTGGETGLTGVRTNMPLFKTPEQVTTFRGDGGGPLGAPYVENCSTGDRVTESVAVHWRDGNWTYEAFGTEAVFRGEGRKWGLDSNPMLQLPHAQWLSCADRLEPTRLSGLSVRLLGQGRDSVVLEVRYDDTEIARPTRWTGELMSTDVPGVSADLRITHGARLLLDRTEAYNRRTRTTWDSSFTNPSLLRLTKGTRTVIEDGSLLVRDDAALKVEAGAELWIGPKGRLEIGAGATLLVDSGAAIYVQGRGQINLEAGAYLSRSPQAAWRMAAGARQRTKGGKVGVSRVQAGYLGLPQLPAGDVLPQKRRK